uniref:Putative acid-CoA ligase n=1 Tax=Rhodopseudomonas palustris (strain BisA53) TaxID=316055 RepID=Q07MV5_RHOP5
MSQSPNASPTLDELFRRIVARQPDALALIDPSDKQRITGQLPRQMTFAEADRAVAALAAHFATAGLPANSVIAVQLPNCIEFFLTVLAAHRAGLVVALLPQLWRQAELTMALNRTGARAIVTTSRIDGIDHANLAMEAAAEVFSIRHVAGFGSDVPEGMAPLDQVIAEPPVADIPPRQDSRRAAIVTFDVTAHGFRPIPRTHLNLVAGGLVVSLESQLPQGGTLLSTLAPSSFAGFTSSLVIWLLSGGTLALHHPFDADLLARQIEELSCDAISAPAGLAMRLAETGALAGAPRLQSVIALWRTPEQVQSSAQWPQGPSSLTDVYLFGEAGLLAARRKDDGTPLPIKLGVHGAPRGANSSNAGETLLTGNGTLGLRGPMVPLAAYAPDPSNRIDGDSPPLDYVDTGYAARTERATGTLCITAPPPGIMAVGGYRFLSQDLSEWARRLGQGALLTALPDRLSGYRLAGRAKDNARAREALAELGLNPLMVEAFRDNTSQNETNPPSALTPH